LTFDDARKSQLDQGAPILAAHGIPATFYVNLEPFQARAEDWLALVRAGHEIGNHTATHPCSAQHEFSRENALEDYTLETMDRELSEASAAIERTGGTAPTTIAYPCGQTFVGRESRRRAMCHSSRGGSWQGGDIWPTAPLLPRL